MIFRKVRIVDSL